MNKFKKNKISSDEKKSYSDLNSSLNDTNAISQTDFYNKNIDDFLNIDDVYNDLSNQSIMLDENINENNIHYNRRYLPKRRIKEILFSKYGIENEECVNELYSMAFSNNWKEIDVEHWLLNPSNINSLLESCGESRLLNTAEEKVENPFLMQYKNKNNLQKNNFDMYGLQNNKPMYYPMPSNFNPNHFYPHYYHPSYSFRDEIKSILIEENYKKMQFQYQTEILKRHFDDRFNSSFNKDKDVFGHYIDAKSIDKKLAKYFSSKSDEFSKEIEEIKQSVDNNDKQIKDALGQMNSQANLNASKDLSNFNGMLNKLRTEFNSQLSKIKTDLNNSFGELINDTIAKQLGSNSQSISDDFEKKMNSKIDNLTNYLNNVEKNIINKNKSLIDDIGDLRGELNNRVSTLSQDMKNTVDNIYDELNSTQKAASNNSIPQGTSNNNLSTNNNQKPINSNVKKNNNQEKTSNIKRDLYSDFISENEISNSSNVVSNFNSNSEVNQLDIEKETTTIIKKEENNKKEDITSKFKRIDEIIKNSIDELNDIKEYVGEEEARIDDSIKLFEKIK